ncbi:hypothetical protein EDB81DRAFT_249744 [Dactylonectria macrodidyma]|uniref:Peptidase S8/S53 domain-containing protein n=1 Tax=Dactylonectria macrodidyma TaxID=307937 RepID=A0A9P9FL87_9HYPO|nr:hypothetical protein EDB81DRAFT_249744 [Dactylonectria macrodidyma]
MNQPTPSKARNQDGDLFLETFETLLDIAKVAQDNETNEDLKAFYIHLGCHSIIFRDHAIFTPQLDDEQIRQILEHLGSLIAESDLPELPTHPVSQLFRLRALNLHWGEIQKYNDEYRMNFIRRWMRPTLSGEFRAELEKSLENCGDILDTQQSNNVPRRHVDCLASPNLNEPSYAVWKPAQSIFDALLDCQTCTCPDRHDFGAKLSLGTYRSPPNLPARNPPRYINSRALHTHSDDGDSLDFDMFLSMEHDWHEVRIKTMIEKLVQWAVAGEKAQAGQPSQGKKRQNAIKVEKLCLEIAEAEKKRLQRRVLKLTEGQLFKLGFERSNFCVDNKMEPISLSQCFEERYQFFTEKVKRILSLVLSCAVLHLHGTSWLQPSWGSSSIKFFQTTRFKTPLRPFIQIQLPESGATVEASRLNLVINDTEGHCSSQSSDLDANDLDDLESHHRCPTLVALAVTLMEIYFVMPFKKLAQNHQIELIEEPDGRVSLADALLVFYGDVEDKIEGCRSQIPEDCPLLTAIEKCLDSELWEDEDGNALDSQTMRPRIYQEVVRPLEAHLNHGFSQIPLEGLDKYAQDLDFGNWGQLASNECLESWSSPRHMEEYSQAPSPSHEPFWRKYPRIGNHSPFQTPTSGFLERMPASSQQIPSFHATTGSAYPMMSFNFDHRASQFFDDETAEAESSCITANRYRAWMVNYENVYEKFITNYGACSSQPAVKIAILDTGIDRDNLAFEPREDNIKGRFNLYNEAFKRQVPDQNGHGTFNASLILDYAPDAELYVAKVADKENARPSAYVVKKAIDLAVQEWKVDIICMSFGWPTRNFDGYDELEAAIYNANSKGVLMFAAASNNGGRQGRAYPARSSSVICIHSTDTYGVASAFSPTASPDDMNLATVGESIKSAWPLSLCDQELNPACVAHKSGTSYATAIAAGIGAFLLQYARLHLPPKKAVALKRRDRMMAVLKRVAERGQSYNPRGGYYYIELSLNPDNLFGKDKAYIDLVLEDILTN